MELALATVALLAAGAALHAHWLLIAESQRKAAMSDALAWERRNALGVHETLAHVAHTAGFYDYSPLEGSSTIATDCISWATVFERKWWAALEKGEIDDCLYLEHLDDFVMLKLRERKELCRRHTWK